MLPYAFIAFPPCPTRAHTPPLQQQQQQQQHTHMQGKFALVHLFSLFCLPLSPHLFSLFCPGTTQRACVFGGKRNQYDGAQISFWPFFLPFPHCSSKVPSQVVRSISQQHSILLFFVLLFLSINFVSFPSSFSLFPRSFSFQFHPSNSIPPSTKNAFRDPCNGNKPSPHTFEKKKKISSLTLYPTLFLFPAA